MLSKKMTVSLTSLITIFALAFVVTPAMAGEFGVSLSKVQDAEGTDDGDTLMDVSHADGTQVSKPSGDTSLRVTVMFDKAVDSANLITVVAKRNVHVSGYGKDGGFLAGVSATVATATSKTQVITVTLGANSDAANMVSKVTLKIDKGIASADAFNADTSKELKTDIHLLPADRTGGPDVWQIALVGEPFSPITTATFQTHILLSEEPKGGFNKDLIEVSDADFSSLVKLVSPATVPTGLVQRGTTAVPTAIAPDDRTSSGLSTWRDDKIHLYLATFKTKAGEKTVKIKIKDFAGMERPTGALTQQTYVREPDSDLTEGRDILTVKTKRDDPSIKTAGFDVVLDKEKRIPASGYLVVATKIADSGVKDNPENDKDEPKVAARTPAELLYNVIEKGLPNLETFLANGGTIDLVAPAGVYISEIMWGSDASLTPNNNSQWIEIANTGTSSVLTGDKTHKLIFYGPNETPPAVSTVADRVGTVGAGGYWSIANKGQSGRTGTGETATEQVAVVPTQALVSMQRVMDAAGAPLDGTMASSWATSVPPGLNFDVSKVGTRVGSPGAAPVAYPATPVIPTEPTPTPPVPGATASDIRITEIMVDTGNGRLPQWIELTNVSGKEVSLADWSLMIANAEDDANVIGATVNINLSGTLGVGGGTDAGGTMGKSLLLVGGNARSSSNLAGSDRVVDISSQVDQRGRYAFISSMAFMAALIPPQTTGVLAYGDTAGNLGADAAWDIPMSENGRSSLIRREMDAAGMATMGTSANGWVLASSTALVSGPATWYGSDEDAGTPGYDAGGPLPVELSHFRPARDKATGAVVITWSTQSELNNAGFFIKRSQQRDGQFQVINATMIAGAGTTSEKQFYTYTDTTAQPNVVYYYQIEDVSLDGQRQTLTLGTRLKGHIGAAGKLTATWGELKSSNE